jgi:hypothetical protein
MKTVYVVEPAVVGLRDHWERERSAQQAVLHLPGDNGVANHAHTVRVGDSHRAFHESGFFDPGRARHFAVAIQ